MSRALAVALFVAALASSAPVPVATESGCDLSGPFVSIGLSDDKQCISQHFPEFSDYVNAFAECRLVVFLTDLANRVAVEELLRPGYRAYAQHLPEGVCPPDGEPIVEFRKARYPYSDMAAWKVAAENRLREVEPARTANVTYFEQELWIFVATDEMMERVEEVMADLGIPPDAYDVGSRETETREAPSIAPVVRQGAAGEIVMLPVHLWSREKVGELVPGATTLDTATRSFPPWPGHGPAEHAPAPKSERAPWISDEMHDAIDTMRYSYNLARTFIYAGFNKTRHLMLVQYEVQDGQEASLLEALAEIASIKEVYSDEGRFVQRGQIGSCITVDAGSSRSHDGAFKLAIVVYVYTCDTGQAR